MLIKQRVSGDLIVGTGNRWVGPFGSWSEAQLWCECEGAEVVKSAGVIRVDVEVISPSDYAKPAGKPSPPATAKSGKAKKATAKT